MENEFLINPHDKFFKETFSHKDTVESFIKEYLPESISKQVDFKTLEILKDSFIDKELSEHFSDILYQAEITGKSSYLYLLFEHKSFEDPFVFFQLLRNMVKIWEQYFKQNPSAKKLPIVIPIIIYHGQKAWSIANSITPLFDPSEELLKYIPDFSSEIIDVSHIPDDIMRGEIALRVLFLVQKYVHSPQLYDKLTEIFVMLSSISTDNAKTKFVETVLRYLTATVEKEKKEHLKEEILKVLKKGDSLMSTIAEEWVKEGKLEGKIEGKIEGKEEDTRKMIEHNMTDQIIHDITGLPLERIKEIRKSLKR
jgi:predicted transposase/invertase (TIGR01784 family)